MQLVDLAGTDRSPLNINAHDSELVALTLNVQGTIPVPGTYVGINHRNARLGELVRYDG